MTLLFIAMISLPPQHRQNMKHNQKRQNLTDHTINNNTIANTGPSNNGQNNVHTRLSNHLLNDEVFTCDTNNEMSILYEGKRQAPIC